MILLLLVVFVSYIYYMAHFFVFKNDKYKSYFKEFESKKGIYCIIAYIPFL